MGDTHHILRKTSLMTAVDHLEPSVPSNTSDVHLDVACEPSSLHQGPPPPLPSARIVYLTIRTPLGTTPISRRVWPKSTPSKVLRGKVMVKLDATAPPWSACRA